MNSIYIHSRLSIAIFILFILLAIIYIGSAIAKLVLLFECSGQICPIEEKISIYLGYGGFADILWIIFCIIAPCCGFKPKMYLVTRKTKVNGQTIKKETKHETHEGLF